MIEPALIVVSARGSGGQENKGQENIGKQGLPFSCPLFSCPLAGMTIEAIEPWGSQMQSRPGEPWTSRKRGALDGSSAAALLGSKRSELQRVCQRRPQPANSRLYSFVFLKAIVSRFAAICRACRRSSPPFTKNHDHQWQAIVTGLRLSGDRDPDQGVAPLLTILPVARSQTHCVTVIESAWVSLAATGWLSRTRTVKFQAPRVVGLPLIVPVVELSVSPGGRLPAEIDHQ